jgi:hypothetical protein
MFSAGHLMLAQLNYRVAANKNNGSSTAGERTRRAGRKDEAPHSAE